MKFKFEKKFPKTQGLLVLSCGNVFPSYGVGVFYQGNQWFSYGNSKPDSLFDLASLTKVLCTTSVFAIAVEKGLLSLDTLLHDCIADFPDKRVTLSHLLNHSAGFPDWLPLHSHFHGEKSLGDFSARQTPSLARKYYEQKIIESYKPELFEKACVYSDLGFLMLGWAIEKKLNTYIDALFQEWIALPHKLSSLQFLPIGPGILPTENCPWRGHVLQGEVHDDNCYVLGGVAAHAGLFGNVEDVLHLAKLWLDCSLDRNSPLTPFLKQSTAKTFFSSTHVPSSVRALGWDGVEKSGSSSGKYFSSNSKGHLGYTGTSLWIDPEQDLIAVCLTNRVFYGRDNSKIKAFRPQFHDTLVLELKSDQEGP